MPCHSSRKEGSSQNETRQNLCATPVFHCETTVEPQLEPNARFLVPGGSPRLTRCNKRTERFLPGSERYFPVGQP